MNENIITWNVTNWITVVLMVAIGWAIVNAGKALMLKKQAAAAGA